MSHEPSWVFVKSSNGQLPWPICTRIHADVPVIQGDICEVQTLIKVKEACPQPFCLMAGVSCQPYSNRGGLHGGKDIRAGTAPAVRQTFRLLQVPRLILECVPPARTNEFVRQDLQHLCQTMDMQSCECTLKLEDTWAANRFNGGLLPCLSVVGSLSVCKLRPTPWITWLYQPRSFCSGWRAMGSLSGFASGFSAPDRSGGGGQVGNGQNGRCGRFSHRRSIHRKWATFKWLQRCALVRLRFCKSVFPVLQYHGMGGAHSRLNVGLLLTSTCSVFLPVASPFWLATT